MDIARVMNFIYSHLETKTQKCYRSIDNWRNSLQKVKFGPQHAQRSKKSADAQKRTADGFEPCSLDAMAAMDWRITVPGLTSLLTCLSISKRYQKEMGTAAEDRV